MDRFLSVPGCSVMFVSVRQLIPAGLADIAPGPELASVLAGLELSRLSGFDCVEVLKAQYRQANHERARVMAAMAQVWVCGPVPDDDLTRMVMPDEFSADEVRAALVLTRRAAQTQFWLAYDLVTRLPRVHAAMDAGVLDEPRARVFSEWTTELSPEQAQAVCSALLPRAPKLTTGQLIEQIKKQAIAVDPAGHNAATNKPSPTARWSATAIRTGQRTCPDATCHWIGSPQPAGTSTHWPRPPNTPVMPAPSTTSARTYSSE